MIREVMVENAFTAEEQPDGSSVIVLDPYTGCQLKCPYCFQWNDPDWNQEIRVNINISELLETQIDEIAGGDIYIGSKCDPYMPIEQKYHLTRKCLHVLSKHHSRTFIVTKSDNQLILEDSDLLKSFLTPPTILLGLSNINQAGLGRKNRNIGVANELKKQGLEVWCFITPILPYIMDIEAMVEELEEHIPIYFDKLRVMEQGQQNERVRRWVDQNYPQYHDQYSKILFENDVEYYKEIYQKYRDNRRFTFMTDEWRS